MGTGASSWLASASLELFPVHEASAVFALHSDSECSNLIEDEAAYSPTSCAQPVARLLLRAQSQGGMMSPRLAATAKKMCESQWKVGCPS
eukprot:404058-Pelagomonas_calceolata.AAC.4